MIVCKMQKYNGVWLNVIYAGPIATKELIDVLVRFPPNPVALACNVKVMYLQVEISDSDHPMFWILWRDLDTTHEPEVYEFNQILFRKNSALLDSQFVGHEIARRHQEEFSRAAETVLKSTYMDESIDSLKKTIYFYQQLDSFWKVAGMQASEWISNSPQVIAATP